MYTTQLNGRKYEARPLDPLYVLQDSGRLGSLIGPALERADLAVDFATLATKAAGILLPQLKHPDFLEVVQHLFESASCNGVELGKTWRTHFAGKTGEMAQAISWLLEAQFSDFFGGVRSSVSDRLRSLFKPTDLPETPLSQP